MFVSKGAQSCHGGVLPIQARNAGPIRERASKVSEYSIGVPFSECHHISLSSLQEKGYRDRNKLTAVVVGAGPAGLASAIVLKSLGWDVLLADKRSEYTRYNLAALREDCYQYLLSLGVELENKCYHAEILNNVKVIESGQAQTQAIDRNAILQEDFSFDGRGMPPMMKSAKIPATISIPIKDLERALNKRASDLGVKLVSNAEITLHRSQETKRLQTTIASCEIDQRSHDAINLGYPDLIISADGKASSTRKQSSSKILEETKPHSYIAAMAHGSRQEYDVAYEKNSYGGLDFTMSHASKGVTWGCFQVSSQDDLTDLAKKKMQDIGSTSGDLMYVSQPFIMNHQRTDKLTDGYNHIFIGDAAGNATAIAGLGANKATYWDANNVRILAESLMSSRSQGTGHRRKALKDFQRNENESIDAWQVYDRQVYSDILDEDKADSFLKI